MNVRDKQRLRRKRARERQLRLIRCGIVLVVGLILSLTGLGILFHARQKNRNRMTYTEQTSSLTETETQSANIDVSTVTEPDYISRLREMAAENPKITQILENQVHYPPELLEMLSKNGEVLEFVLDYPEKSGLEPAKNIGNTIHKGTVPLLIQWDERWGYAPYGTETTVAVSGCGPTCLAMVASGLTGDNTITPAVVADYASANGYLDSNLDTAWELMTVGCQHFGINGAILGLDENVMATVLASGSPIICSMSPGIFTTSGHFIVLTSYQNGAFTVHDPASKIRSSRTYTFSEIRDQIKNMWYFTEN